MTPTIAAFGKMTNIVSTARSHRNASAAPMSAASTTSGTKSAERAVRSPWTDVRIVRTDARPERYEGALARECATLLDVPGSPAELSQNRDDKACLPGMLPREARRDCRDLGMVEHVMLWDVALPPGPHRERRMRLDIPVPVGACASPGEDDALAGS
jgi:hypothetical protein